MPTIPTRQLIHIADIRRNSTEPPPQSASGEPTPDWSTEAIASTINCRYVQKTERIANEAAGYPLIRVDLLLFDDSEDVLETDVVNNIKYRDGEAVVDAGPFRITSVLTRNRYSAHHKSVTMERVDGKVLT